MAKEPERRPIASIEELREFIAPYRVEPGRKVRPGDFDPHPLDAMRQQRGGRHHPNPRAHGVEQDDVGTRDT